MHHIWLSKHPDSTISEQRLADQRNVIMRRNLLTSVAIEEIQRGLSTQTCHTESSIPEQPKSNQPDLTPIEEIPQQQQFESKTDSTKIQTESTTATRTPSKFTSNE